MYSPESRIRREDDLSIRTVDGEEESPGSSIHSKEPETMERPWARRRPLLAVSVTMCPVTPFTALTAVVSLVAVSMIISSTASDQWHVIDYDTTAIAQHYNKSNLNVTLTFPLPADPSAFFVIHLNASNETYHVYRQRSGVWKLCDDLSDSQRPLLPEGYQERKCYSFLEHNSTVSPGHNAEHLVRMNKAALSHVIVIYIIIVTAVMMSVTGLATRIVIPIMVTGTLFILAGVFCAFALAMVHVMLLQVRTATSAPCLSLLPLPPHDVICSARHVTTAWCLPLLWVASSCCLLAAVFWLQLARLVRYEKLTMLS